MNNMEMEDVHLDVDNNETDAGIRTRRAGSYKGDSYTAKNMQPTNNNNRQYHQMSPRSHQMAPGGPKPPPEGCHPRTANAIAYFGAVGFFFLGFNVPFEMEMTSPVLGNLLPRSLWNFYPEVVVLPLLMWGIHFARRFGEVLFLHKYLRRMGCCESSGASIYYWGFGLWIGLSQNFHLGYLSSHPAFVYPGLALFVTGEVGNCFSHFKLMKLRQMPSGRADRTSSRRIMPTGTLFEYVSCPHYAFELVTWMGYALVSMTLSSIVFLLCSTITLLIYANKHHQQYVKEFDGSDGKQLYPPKRKALIPFIF